eukprot:1137005-Pelagomonas_calceolata.AAC.1
MHAAGPGLRNLVFSFLSYKRNRITSSRPGAVLGIFHHAKSTSYPSSFSSSSSSSSHYMLQWLQGFGLRDLADRLLVKLSQPASDIETSSDRDFENLYAS